MQTTNSPPEVRKFHCRFSSFITALEYNMKTMELTVHFKSGNSSTYRFVYYQEYDDFCNAHSKGKYYSEFRKSKNKNMADKLIKLKIDVTKLNKAWFFKGEKGVYADLTLLYNEKQDQYENNGFIVQDIPKDLFKADPKTPKGPVLGNAKVWLTDGERLKPGEESGKLMAATPADELTDDLPF